MRTYTLYVLTEPNTMDVRYVGITNNLKRRVSQHNNPKFNKGGAPLIKWLTGVKESGHRVSFNIIKDAILEEDVEREEIEHISLFKSIGADLLNRTIGGKGCVGMVTTDETRLKLKNSHTGYKHKESSLAKISANSKAMQEKMRLNGHKHITAEVRAKMSEKRKGVPAINKGVIMTDEEKKLLAHRRATMKQLFPEIKRLIEGGVPIQDVATTLGLSYASVYKKVRFNNITSK